MKFSPLAAIALYSLCSQVSAAADSLTPYTEETVPQNVVELWKDVDLRADKLETEVVQEWKEDGVVCRYVIFKVGTFKGANSRVAAFYTFPEGMKSGAAFVWSHGGGQRAERERGTYFAKQGFATLDINWGGREIVEGIEKNTDWGKVDPSQGPRFYPGALRPNTKLNLLPDEHTIDTVVSPRNGNWFLLTLAGRRGITFLERQPEVDPEKIGFTGFSMGGTITSMAAIDGRLKAVVPMVGGSGFLMSDFPGIPNSSKARGYKHPDLFTRTIDSSSYWPLVKCPVLFLSGTNDFHSEFENIYKSMALLPHDDWRVSQKMHYSHSLGSDQWILLNRWFDRHLKGEPVEIPETAESDLKVSPAASSALFTVRPDGSDQVSALDVYYSHDPNPRARFWKSATSKRDGGVWIAKLPVREHLPLFAFANVTYPLDGPSEALQGKTENYTITSKEEVYLPDEIKLELLKEGATFELIFEGFSNGIRDWGTNNNSGLQTYKFQDPSMATPKPTHHLRFRVDAPKGKLSIRLRILKNSWLTGVKEQKETFSAVKGFANPGEHEIVFSVSDFQNAEKEPMADWENVATFTLQIYDGENRRMLDLTSEEGRAAISKIEWISE